MCLVKRLKHPNLFRLEHRTPPQIKHDYQFRDSGARGAQECRDRCPLPRIHAPDDIFECRRGCPRTSWNSIKHIIIIYQENWSFDSLYGQFPGADGYANGFDNLPQLDKTAPAYTSLIYKTPSPLDENGAIDTQFPSFAGYLSLNPKSTLALPLIPYDFTAYIPTTGMTGDIVHRFYHEQLQIDNGVLEAKNGDLGQVRHLERQPGPRPELSRRDNLPEGQLAQQYTLCDNFFHSAYGGSFLNHQWLTRGEPALDDGDSDRICHRATTQSTRLLKDNQ